jgi:hypothetical protein
MDRATRPNAHDGAARPGARRATPSHRPTLELIAPAASAEEAAAIVAALERFMRATAPPAEPEPADADAWRRAAILEGVEHWECSDSTDPWINT